MILKVSGYGLAGKLDAKLWASVLKLSPMGATLVVMWSSSTSSTRVLVDRLWVVYELAHLLWATATLGDLGGPLIGLLRVFDFEHREAA